MNISNPTRILVYYPIVHTQADMGALKESVVRATLEKSGRIGLTRKKALIDQVWTEIEKSIEGMSLAFDRVRLYQDGLPVCGREAAIVAELAQQGSRNHQLLLRLMDRGAVLMGTEDRDLLLQEYQLSKQVLKGSQPRSAGVQTLRRQRSENLLTQRDHFMARRINETLRTGETGILFIGLFHSLRGCLDQDIKVIYPLQPR